MEMDYLSNKTTTTQQQYSKNHQVFLQVLYEDTIIL